MTTKRRPKHHRVQKGKKVLVALEDGSPFFAKFISSSSRFLFTDKGRWAWKNITQFNTYRMGR